MLQCMKVKTQFHNSKVLRFYNLVNVLEVVPYITKWFFLVSFRETENFSSSVFGRTEYKAATKMWWTYDGADDTACCSDVQQKIAEVTFSLILKTNSHELRQGLTCPRPENMLLTTPRRIKKKKDRKTKTSHFITNITGSTTVHYNTTVSVSWNIPNKPCKRK